MENIIDEHIVTHEIKLNDRSRIMLSGIKKIDSFDDREFILESSMGRLQISGSNLELIRIDTQDGNVKIKGKINGILYIEDKKSKDDSLISKLFK